MAHTHFQSFNGQYEVNVRRVETNETLFVRSLSAKYYGVLTHYVEGSKTKRGGTRYCFKSESKPCKHCGSLESVWKGYSGCEMWVGSKEVDWMPICLEVTERLDWDFKHRFERGTVWRIFKQHGPTPSKHSPVRGDLTDTIDRKTLPKAFDVIVALTRYFHHEPKALYVPNPTPRPQTAEPSRGSPPKALQELQDEPDIPTAEEIAPIVIPDGAPPPHVGEGITAYGRRLRDMGYKDWKQWTRYYEECRQTWKR